jgi:hypothetical protein
MYSDHQRHYGDAMYLMQCNILAPKNINVDEVNNVIFESLFEELHMYLSTKIPMRYGQRDIAGPEDCVNEGNLPDAGPPSSAEDLHKVFYQMGLSDQDIVALSGAHTLGRSRLECNS